MTIYITMSAYNEEKSLPPLFNKILDVFKHSSYSFKVILVDDGSSDKTVKVAQSYLNKLPLEIISHNQNKGLGEGIKTSIKKTLELASDSDVMITMDADDTHHPKYIIPMIKRIEEESDVVIASRFRKGSKQIGVPFLRKIVSLVARFLFRFTLNVKGVRDYTCGFRAFRVGIVRKAYEKFGEKIITKEGFACTDELLINLLNVTNNVSEIPFTLFYNQKGSSSKLQFWKTVKSSLAILFKSKNK